MHAGNIIKLCCGTYIDSVKQFRFPLLLSLSCTLCRVYMSSNEESFSSITMLQYAACFCQYQFQYLSAASASPTACNAALMWTQLKDKHNGPIFSLNSSSSSSLHALFPKRNATLICPFSLVPLGHWLCNRLHTDGSAKIRVPFNLWKCYYSVCMASDSLAYTLPQKNCNFKKVVFLLEKSVFW